MTKRRIDDSSFANVLRQKIKEDPIQKQQVGNLKTHTQKKEREKTHGLA